MKHDGRGARGRYKRREGLTPFATQVIAYYEAGFSYQQIGRLVDRHPSTIGNVMRRLRPDLIRRERKGITYQRIPNIEFERTRLLYEKGLSLSQVGRALGLTQAAVSYRLDRAGVPRRSNSEGLKLAYANGSRKPSGFRESQNGTGPELSARV